MTPPPAPPNADTGLDLLDSGKARRMLTALALMVASADIATLAANWLEYGGLVRGMALPHLVLMLVVLALTRWRRLRLAIAVLLWGMNATVLIGSAGIAGLNTPALIGLPIVGTCAGWLLGKRQTMWLLGATILGLALLAALQYGGEVPSFVERTPAAIFVLLSAASIAGAVIGLLSMANFRAEFARTLALSEAQARQIEALAASERRFTTLFRSNPLPSTITEGDGTIIDANDAWLQMTGLQRDAVLGRRGVSLGLWVDPRQLEALIEQGRRSEGRIDGATLRLRTVAGEREFLLHTEAVTIDGKFCFINALLDQTDRLAAEAAQRELNEQLEARLAERSAQLHQAQQELLHNERLVALGGIVAGISHELNTPLGNALTTASSLQADARALSTEVEQGALRRSDLRDQLERLGAMSDLIERSTQRAADLVASFKRVAVDQTSEQRRSFDLATVIHDLIATLRPTLLQLPAPPALEIVVPAGLECDSFPGPLGQILANLIQNAAVHAFAPSASGTIRIAAHTDGNHIVLSVSDNGCGIDEATQARIFDPFFTTRLGKGGSGLGLTVSQRLATAVLGGMISVHAALPQGSEFRLRFPRQAPGRV